jgi:CHAP domain
MDYPGRVIKMGETDTRIVRALKQALNQQLVLKGAAAVKLDADNPNFGPQMKQAVQLFQARSVDPLGNPLKPDGEVGAITWGRLFGAQAVPAVAVASAALLAKALEVAATQEGVRELPVNSNRGPEVERYLASVRLGGGFAWCCAFTYWCFDEAAQQMGRSNPVVRTAGCLDHWAKSKAAGAIRITKAHAVADPSLVQPGMCFIMDFGGGKGHTGFVTEVLGGQVRTIEGNTDASKGREGGGVYRLTRKLADINKGYIDYSPC